MSPAGAATGKARRRASTLAVAFAAAALPACRSDRVDAPRPNIVLVSIDSLRADHLGCYGYSRRTSPVIDGLAERGVLFETVTSSTSWTLPAHAALFTALPDSAHAADRGSRKLAGERRTLAESLRAAGYRTLGVWSGPLLDPRFGFAQGFDQYLSHEGEAGGREGVSWDEAVATSHRVVTGPGTVQVAEALVRSGSEEPYFLFVHLWDVHYDYTPPPPFDGLFDPDYAGDVDGRDVVDYLRFGPGDLPRRDLEHLVALYDGEIAWTDRQLGELLRRLEGAGGGGETLVLVTSDHGEEFFEHGFLGHKRQLFDESIRIPLVICCGERMPAGRRVAEPARIVDIAPTILELAGAEPLPDVMGRSLLPQIEGRAAPAVAAVSELVQNPETGDSLLAVRTSDWKVLFRPAAGVTLGFWDLRKDPREETNLLLAGGGLTTGAASTLRSTLEELGRLRTRHAPAEQTESLDDDIRRQLEALGYLEPAGAAGGGPIRAAPNPIRVCDGSGLGVTTLTWSVEGAFGGLEVRVDSPQGKLFAATGAFGSSTTGRWVRDGTVFYLLAQETGEVLSREVVRLTTSGCEPD